MSLPLSSGPIQFGTDGWRGVIGVDFTMERLLCVAAASAQELSKQAPRSLISKTIIIGYDCRFLSRDFAEAVAAAVHGCGLNPLLSKTSVPTPSCSFGVIKHQALGALVITASHNPSEWLGLKIKGPFGGSVHEEFTNAVERRIMAGGVYIPTQKKIEFFDAREEHLEDLRKKINLPKILNGMSNMGLKVIIDSMHGSASGCISDLFGGRSSDVVREINTNRDVLFGGNPPEPIPPYINELTETIKACNSSGKKTIGLVFDGDGDRLAAIDEKGRYCSNQLLIPLLVEHLSRSFDLQGSVLKTVSGSDLISLVAENFNLKVVELPVGFKHITLKMLEEDVLIGGEESGGIGFGMHIPERDALFGALLVLEAIVQGGLPLGERIDLIKKTYGNCEYGRIDIKLSDMNFKKKLEVVISENPPTSLAGFHVHTVDRIDGIKLRMGVGHWLMIRFSGTEPLLRIYCEARDKQQLNMTLQWAKEYVGAL